jgi:AraC-like DNA-binding protein
LPKRYQLVSKFRQLVEKNYLHKRKVSEYAELLFVTPHYLNDTVKEMTGKSASTYIQEQVLMEAKAQLIQTECTVTQIAANIKFSDQSYFCRFFRKMTGKSPEQYRHQTHIHIQQ